MLKTFDAYDLLTDLEKEQVTEIILEATCRKYDLEKYDIDYELKTTLILSN
jgi:hypothetical protein